MSEDWTKHGARADPLWDAEKVEGWMEHDELLWLWGMASRSYVGIEIGSHMGRSTKAIAGAIREFVVCVDAWSMTEYNGAEAKFRENLKWEIQRKQVRVVKGKSAEVAGEVEKALGGRKADFVFLDGDHRYDSLMKDIETYRKFLSPGGLLCGHDFYQRSWPDVTRAVMTAFPKTYRLGPKNIWYVHA